MIRIAYRILVALQGCFIEAWLRKQSRALREHQRMQRWGDCNHGKNNMHKWKNKIIKYADIFDSTKGYPGEGPGDEERNKNRKPKSTFDSTKGYPGEGPGHTNSGRMGKKREASTARGDIRWGKTLLQWAKLGKETRRAMGNLHTIGHDLWYTKAAKIDWANIRGKIIGLNMEGWGGLQDRMGLWAQLSEMRTMVMW